MLLLAFGVRSMKRYLCFVLLMQLVVSCGFVEKRKAIRNCDFTLKGVSLESLDLFGVRYTLNIGVHNPNDIEAILDSFDFALYLNENKLLEGVTKAKLSVPPHKSQDLKIDARSGYSNIAKFVNDIKSDAIKDYKIVGGVNIDTVIGRFYFPVEFGGRFR